MIQTALNQNSPEDQEQKTLMASIHKAKRFTDPFTHWIPSDLFTPQTLNELQDIPYTWNHLKYEVGTREENNAFRHYFDVESQKKYPIVRKVADLFHTLDVLQTFTDLCGV